MVWDKAYKDVICAEGWNTAEKHTIKRGELGKGANERKKDGTMKFNFYCKKCYETRFLYKGQEKIDIGL